MRTNIQIVIPCFNEELILEKNIKILHEYLKINLQNYNYTIIIASNGSTDNTDIIAKKISHEIQCVQYVYIKDKGRGNALRTIWQDSNADIMGFTDADLSLSIDTLPILIDAINNKECDIAIASRYNKHSKTIGKSKTRTIISLVYSYMIRNAFRVSFRDPQCGMKIINKYIAKTIIPYVKDNTWFFDTELLVYSEKLGYTVKEFSTTMIESSRPSSVNIISTSINNIICIIRLIYDIKKLKLKIKPNTV